MKLIKGTAKAQTLFMGGKLKIKGDMMKATRLEPILSQARPQAKL
jgi:putative sterol carrier protein